jgi:hypothetical protein
MFVPPLPIQSCSNWKEKLRIDPGVTFYRNRLVSSGAIAGSANKLLKELGDSSKKKDRYVNKPTPAKIEVH